MKLLGIETSTRACSVAVCEGETLLAEMTVAGKDRPSDHLMAGIEQCLAAAGVAAGDLDGIAVSAGPGSFTGIRIGVTVAKTLAYTLGKPVTTVSSLDVLAANVPAPRWPLWVFVDARKEKLYAARYEIGENKWPMRIGEEQLVTLERLLPQVIGEVMILGDGLVRYGAAIRDALGARGHSLPPALWVPRASAVCRLASAPGTAPADDPHALVPRYLFSKESDVTGW